MAADWISADTEEKERHYSGLLGMHVKMCKGIIGRRGGPPYLYVDLHAGPGQLQFNGHRFLGSPLIFQKIIQREQLRHEALYFEQDPETAAQLGAAVAHLNGTAPVIHAEACEAGMRRWLLRNPRQWNRLGLVYADPIAKEIPHELLAAIAQKLPQIDLLSYVSATAYKRRRGVDLDRARLDEHIQAVGKRYIRIREPLGRHQWTFILWTNWRGFPDWPNIGLYRLDSEHGRQILDRLTLTAREWHEATNVPLFQDEPPFDDDPPYRTYAEYLKHPRFLAIRVQVFERAGGVCERCRDRPPSEPHHLRYPPWGQFDVPENLLAVCHPCHCRIHGKER